jgi:hypothetical protein
MFITSQTLKKKTFFGKQGNRMCLFRKKNNGYRVDRSEIRRIQNY